MNKEFYQKSSNPENSCEFSGLKQLRVYYKKYRPKVYVFEGTNGGQNSASSIRSILSRAVKSAGIRKRVTPHTLRHSFATHLFEDGVDLRYIQILLGHGSSKSLGIYTHLTICKLKSILSPIDWVNFING